MEETKKAGGNPLGSEKIEILLRRFALPSIVAMLVSAIYNIVDQLFIGHAVGPLGNAATNIAFPLAMMCTAISLLFGIGGASNFNLAMGAGKKDEAPFYVGNSLTMLVGLGSLLLIVTEILLEPMLFIFGSPDDVFSYARDYVMITAIGFPALILTVGGGHLIRADGSPKIAMFCNMTGAVLNIGLDALFVMGLGWGMKGAALATIIGQFISGAIVVVYMFHFKTVKLEAYHFIPKFRKLWRIISLGAASCVNQIAMVVVQISLNNLLKRYGAQSAYGESIPIACAGIVIKVSQLFFAVIIGISQGSQPIEGFNYGAKQYKRVKSAYMLAMKSAMLVSLLAFAIFQIFPRQLLSLFGEGNEHYYQFGVSFFRIYLAGFIINFMQPLTSTFFTSIGKAYKGMFLSLTRQILFLLPCLFAFSSLMGIEGILYAGPTADLLAFITASLMVRHEFKIMTELEKKNTINE